MSETVKIQTVGPEKKIPNKKDENNPYRSFGLQFEGDPEWYDTFWTEKEDPQVGQELTGTKSEDPKWGMKFETERKGGRGNWNPAGAQATVMLAGVEAVNGFLSLPGMYELWEKNDPSTREKFKKYLATVDSAANQLKQRVVAMGSMQQEQKTEEKSERSSGEPGTVAPPEIDSFPPEEETGI